ncbi:hypothetical protein [Microbacterium sp.]
MVHDPDAARAALEDFYGGEVPESMVARVIVRDLDDEHTHPFVD